MMQWLQNKFLSPKTFYTSTTPLLPWLLLAFMCCFSYGIIDGLFIAPSDYQQGDGFRIMYVHVPSAFTAMAIYSIMASCAFITLVWRVKVAAICMSCSAPIGAWFTFLALVTGSIWGKPMWGTWWIWDARLTSVLILLPILHYSVIWWNTLHQGPSISKFAAPSIAKPMLYPLLAMIVAFFLFYALMVLLRIRNQILLREMKSQWVKEVFQYESA
jgi:heme exporter protein C